jgi:hypothetical protein
MKERRQQYERDKEKDRRNGGEIYLVDGNGSPLILKATFPPVNYNFCK